ncbi:DUF7383 domain-containing protein [Halobaculum gomorrense]|uniref:Uncharacterized protein n=1 Tax=Halobaculum gomorrense TaxID=43928 RepID=A0A1M5JWX7_9EURY|nr:hypothetical protein [Halobaculum gomorrense]SHG44523.1 hypothetical protein SAMN05443636_0280 [Halobaculum gomorrense]
MTERATYATVYLGAQLAPEETQLELDWADDAGDRTDDHEFEVSTDDPREAYLEIQAFDVGEYGHEVLVNGEPLSGFDIPPNDGWQLWTDTVSGVDLREGTNTLAIARDPDSDDAFAVGTVRVHWKESVDGFRSKDPIGE